MSVEIWPPLPPEQLEIAIATTRKRELEWLLEELHETLKNLKLGLEECYALLAPIDPGSTLVVSTPRHEIVKGHVTRVGTRIVKGTIHVRLRTLPPQTLVLNQAHPIHIAALTSLNALLTQSIDLLSLTMCYAYDADPSQSTRNTDVSSRVAIIPPSSSPTFIAAQLRLLAQSLTEASALLKGPPLTDPDPSWTYHSAAPSHFSPPLPPMHLPHASHLATSSSSSTLSTLTNLAGVGHSHHSHHADKPGTADADAGPPALSFHLGIQDSCLVLWLRSLEPANAPVHLGTKLALAIGTTRRLEHDEAERIFGFCCGGLDGDNSRGGGGAGVSGLRHPSPELPSPFGDAAALAGGALSRTNSAPLEKTLGGAAPRAAGVTTTRTASPLDGGRRGNNSSSSSSTVNKKKHGPEKTDGGDGGSSSSNGTGGRREVSVFVREKVRVESADPSLLALSAKLTALAHSLALARQNLAAVMGEELED